MAAVGVGIFRMKSFSHRLFAARARFAFLWLLALAAAAPLWAQIQPGFKGSGWKFPEYYETARSATNRTYPLKGLISGAEGRHLSNSFYFVTGMQLEHYEWNGATNLLARAPECLFNMETRVASSTGRLEIVGMGGTLTIEGNQGFQARMTNATLTVSNRVRTTIRQGLIPSNKP
jgi:hypothetical protein